MNKQKNELNFPHFLYFDQQVLKGDDFDDNDDDGDKMVLMISPNNNLHNSIFSFLFVFDGVNRKCSLELFCKEIRKRKGRKC